MRIQSLAFTVLTDKGKLSFYFSYLDSTSISTLSFIVLEHGTEIMHIFCICLMKLPVVCYSNEQWNGGKYGGDELTVGVNDLFQP